jgi:hypothetical protein
MNSHLMERIASENNLSILHSIEFFIAMSVVLCVSGLLFFAVV